MEKLLLFHCPVSEQCKIKQAAANLKIPCEPVPDADYRQTLGALASGKRDPLTAPYTDSVPQTSLLVLCRLSDKRMDRLLFELKKARVSVDFKAVLTPTNQNWSVLKLLLEMHREKAAYEGNRETDALHRH